MVCVHILLAHSPKMYKYLVITFQKNNNNYKPFKKEHNETEIRVGKDTQEQTGETIKRPHDKRQNNCYKKNKTT